MPVTLFKEKIANETGVPVSQQRLIFRGKVLKDEHVLSDYRILQFVEFNLNPAHDLGFKIICALCTSVIFSLLNNDLLVWLLIMWIFWSK